MWFAVSVMYFSLNSYCNICYDTLLLIYYILDIIEFVPFASVTALMISCIFCYSFVSQFRLGNSELNLDGLPSLEPIMDKFL